MQLAAWVAVCLAAAILLSHRPLVLALGAITLWCAVPGIAGHQITGVESGLMAFQPAAVLVVIAFLMQAIIAPNLLGAALLHRPEWTVLLGAVSAIALMTGKINGLGFESATTAVNQLVAPVFLFFLIGSVLLERPQRVQVIRSWVLGIAGVESLLALVQWASRSALFFRSDFDQTVFMRTSPGRWMGTFDHPLVLSLYLVVAIFLLAGVRRAWLATSLMLLFAAGIVVSQSRVGIAFGVVGIVYFVTKARVAVERRLAVLATTALAVAAALQLGAGAAVLARVADDTGSSSARGLALEYFLDHLGDYLWFGRGLNGSFAVSDGAGLKTSFESAVLMYTIDLGLVVALMYFGVMIWTVARCTGRSALPGISGAAAAAVLVPQTFSALSGVTAAPMTVWTTCALAGFCALGRPRRSVDRGLAGRPTPRRVVRPRPAGSPSGAKVRR